MLLPQLSIAFVVWFALYWNAGFFYDVKHMPRVSIFRAKNTSLSDS